jgi:hypothetical protein
MNPSGMIDSVKSAVLERSVSPLFGSFLLSWCAWNYRFILTIFSDLKLNEKLDFIDTVLFPNTSAYIYHGLLYPLATTAFIIFIYPFPAKWTFQFWRKRQRELRIIRQTIDDETPLTLEESRELRKQMLQQKIEYGDEIKRKDEEIELLRKAPKTPQKTESPVPATPKPRFELPSECIEILGLMAKGDGRIGEEPLFSKISKPKVAVQSFIDILTQKNLISREKVPGEQVWYYILTQTGRAAVMELKLV